MSKTEKSEEHAGLDKFESSPDDRDDCVGYCRPPRHSRFQKGDRGNPKGRRKGRRNFLTDLRDSLAETVEISKGGAPRKITMQQALIRAMLASASKNPRLAAILLDRIEKLDATDAPPAESKLAPEEQAILEAFLATQIKD